MAGRSRSRFRTGTTALLRQALGGLPRGTVVKVLGVIEGSDPTTYLVQALVSAVVDHRDGQPEPTGPTLVVDGALLARSLPGFRSGVSIVLPWTL